MNRGQDRAEITLKVSTISFAGESTIDTNIFEFNRIEIIVAREEKLGNFEKLFDWLVSKWSRIEKCGNIFKTVNGARWKNDEA